MKGTWQGKESICRPVSKCYQGRLQAHLPADSLLALPDPFHVFIQKFTLLYLIHIEDGTKRLTFSLQRDDDTYIAVYSKLEFSVLIIFSILLNLVNILSCISHHLSSFDFLFVLLCKK